MRSRARKVEEDLTNRNSWRGGGPKQAISIESTIDNKLFYSPILTIIIWTLPWDVLPCFYHFGCGSSTQLTIETLAQPCALLDPVLNLLVEYFGWTCMFFLILVTILSLTGPTLANTLVLSRRQPEKKADVSATPPLADFPAKWRLRKERRNYSKLAKSLPKL